MNGFPGAIYPDQKIAELTAENARLRAMLMKLAEPIAEPAFKWAPAKSAYWKREASRRVAMAGVALA